MEPALRIFQVHNVHGRRGDLGRVQRPRVVLRVLGREQGELLLGRRRPAPQPGESRRALARTVTVHFEGTDSL